MSNVAHIARSLVGTPFRHQGRSAQFGVDCVGLIILCAEGRLVDVADYPEFGSKRLLREIVKQMVPAGLKRQAGDVLLFTRNVDRPMHVGIAVDDKYVNIVHADASVGMVVEMPLTSVGNLHSCWRIV